jgi:uncharacterized protein YecE (DUF72 family)
MQLPPYFGIDRIKILEHFLKEFPKDIPLAIEFRHESWFKSTLAKNEMLALLVCTAKHSLITDVAGRRDVLHMGLASDKVVIRFVGNGLHPTDYQRIDSWVTRISNWQKQGLKEVYFFTHEPDNILAPDLADYLHQQLSLKTDMKVRGPKFYGTEDGEQMSLF